MQGLGSANQAPASGALIPEKNDICGSTDARNFNLEIESRPPFA